MQAGFEIIFEDSQILVVNKPAGIATQAPAQFDSLEARVRQYQQPNGASEAAPYLGIPHRLDRCVSGVVVFAKSKTAAQRLSKQFENRLVDKQYHALVAGQVRPAAGTWVDHVRKLPGQPCAEVVAADHPEGRVAVMHYVLEETDGSWSRLSVRLETGRMHQIRVQCAARGFPVLGDALYGSAQPFGPPWEHERERTIALHATEITFVHPKTRERVGFRAAFPPYWNSPAPQPQPPS